MMLGGGRGDLAFLIHFVSDIYQNATRGDQRRRRRELRPGQCETASQKPAHHVGCHPGRRLGERYRLW
jgi:hypothetical protein